MHLSFAGLCPCSAKTRSNVILPGIFGLSASRFWDGRAAHDPSRSGPRSGRLRMVPRHDRSTAGRAPSAARCLETQCEEAEIEKKRSAVLVLHLKGVERLGVRVDPRQTRNGDPMEEAKGGNPRLEWPAPRLPPCSLVSVPLSKAECYSWWSLLSGSKVNRPGFLGDSFS